mmetsp:Transcript_31093/g.35414  ORF Transcript_31093/g.35414 Transcript_31093/m.35414 type:complete len:333 (-) Transcript_31093:241-1239(-)
MPSFESRRANRQAHCQRALDGMSICVFAALVYYKPLILNPWELTAWQWLLGGLLIRGAIAFYDHLVVYIIDSICQENFLPTRTTGKPVRYVTLDTKSVVFLTINAFDEWIFVQRLCHFIWYSPDVSLDLNEISVVNTIGAIYVMFIVLDVIYAPCHHILHMPWCYKYIHKHHHRQHFPTRGYLDAGNEHPIEHVVGILCTWGAVLTAVYGPTGAHGVTLFFFFNIHAALAMLNHSPYDVEFAIIPYGIMKYSVANHEMHHRKYTINYAQYCMWYDYLMNTYRNYEGPPLPKNDLRKKDSVKEKGDMKKKTLKKSFKFLPPLFPFSYWRKRRI